MEPQFLPVGGATARPEDLTHPKAKDLALRLASSDIAHAALVECRCLDSAEIVIADVRVEVPNRRVHPILRRERVAATFLSGVDDLPKVEALRADFPLVPHLNLHLQEYPRSLCLYEERYDELKRRWTAARFVHRIREWLELNSKGELHPEDQRLEPLLVGHSGHIVLPPDIFSNATEQLHVTGIAPGGTGRCFLVTHRHPPADGKTSLAIIAKTFYAQPRTHGVIYRRPVTLAEVAEISRSAGLDLIADLRMALANWREDALDSSVVLLLVFPQKRSDDGPVEDYETWCFAIAQSVRQLGIELGIWEEVNGELGTLLNTESDSRGQRVPVDVLNPCLALTRDAAARLNGMTAASDLEIAGIGVGALGSQIVMNLARAGFGRWTVIDPDVLMPHNIARHALDGSLVGFSKAATVAYSAGTMTSETEVFRGLDGDVLRPGDKSEDIEAVLDSAAVIADMTASVAAQRYLARGSGATARRLSAFLNPCGTDLVLLAEDAGRELRLDAIEMQYYRALLHDPGLADHIDAPDGPQRYARSCGETTSAIPQDRVALHAAIASRTLKELLSEDAAFASVWRADADCSVRRIPIELRSTTEFMIGAWTVVLDDGLREGLSRSRAERLPNETGGVLLGAFDLERKILYVVDTLPSPPDSRERTDLYIRGCEGLRHSVLDVDRKTGGMLEYIGEWHSHPRGARTNPSDYDLAAFGWLSGLMSKDGLPAAMMIVGDGGEMGLFIGSMCREASPVPKDRDGSVLA